MMPTIVTILYALGLLVFIVLLIYVIVKRLDEKKGENFEKRDN